MSRFASCSLGERRFAALVEGERVLPLEGIEELGAATPSTVLADPPLTGESLPLADVALRPVVPSPGRQYHRVERIHRSVDGEGGVGHAGGHQHGGSCHIGRWTSVTPLTHRMTRM